MMRLNLLGAELDAVHDGFRRATVLVVLAVASVGIFSGALWLAASRSAALEDQVAQLRSATDAAHERLAADRVREEQFAVLARAAAEFRAAPDAIADLVTRLDAFAALLPDDVWCETIEVSAGHVSATGVAAEGRVVNSLLDRLAHMPHPQRIELASTSPRGSASPSHPEASAHVPFSLRMSTQLPAS